VGAQLSPAAPLGRGRDRQQLLADPGGRRGAPATGVQAICEQHVDAVFASLDNLLNDIDPEGACEIFQFCEQTSQAA
jgi:hypothetical protein